MIQAVSLCSDAHPEFPNETCRVRSKGVWREHRRKDFMDHMVSYVRVVFRGTTIILKLLLHPHGIRLLRSGAEAAWLLLSIE